MTRTTDITSFTEHRQHLRAHFEQVRETGRPLYVTTNGRTDAVVMSAEAYDRLAKQVELLESLATIDRSMEEVREGSGHSLRDALREIAAKHGLDLDR